MGSLTGATARAAALLKVGSVAPAADRDHPNHLGANHRMVFRLVLGRTQAVIGEYTFAMAPSRISRTPSVRMAIHETAAGRTVDMPRDAEGQVHYVISGTTGFWPSGAGPNAPDGMAELHALKAIFDAFINPTAIGFARDDLELHWINPDEPVTAFDHVGDAAYLVVPAGNGVEVHRQAGSANFNYTIRLIAIGRVRQPRVDRSRRAEARRLSLLQRVRAALGALQAYSFDTLFAQYQLLIAPYAQVITLVGDVRAFLEGWVSGVDTFLAYNERLVTDLVTNLNGIHDAIAAAAGIDADDRFDDNARVLRGVDTLRRSIRQLDHAARATPSARAPGLGQGGAAAGAALTPQRSVVALANDAARLSPGDLQTGVARAARVGAELGSLLVSVEEGDTLQELTPSGFTDIDVINLNPALRFPWVDGTRARPEGSTAPTAFIGELLRVPTAATSRVTSAIGDSPVAELSARGPVEEASLIFGQGLYVDGVTRALAFEPLKADIKRVRGVENVVQRLQMVVRIPAGALRYAPGIGSTLAEAMGQWADAQRIRLARIALQNAVVQDPAIIAVEGVDLTVVNGALAVAFRAITVGGSTLGPLALTLR